MCIISFYKEGEQIILTHNRDEQISRIASQDIEKGQWNNKDFFAPIDQQKNGTWIFYSNQYIACILNGGKEKPIKLKDEYSKSRGIVLLNLMNYNSVEEFTTKEDLTNIAPFTIFVFDRTNNMAFLLFWNEEELQIKELTRENFVFRASSTLYSFERMRELENIFYKFNEPSANSILDIHKSIRMKDGDVVKGIATTSITQIVCSTKDIDMKYCRVFE